MDVQLLLGEYKANMLSSGNARLPDEEGTGETRP